MPEVPNISSFQTYDPQAMNVFGRSTLGKNDFLNLLVTQLRYQNPMEPLKDSDFVAQLAQFSSLEQLENINTGLSYASELDYMLSQTIANTMATTIIGKEVVAEGNTIYHMSGSDDNLHFKLSGAAQNIEIQVYNQSGGLVRTINSDDLDEGMNSISWDGKDDGGTNVAEGEYTFSVTATDTEGESVNVETRVVGIIDSVRYENGMGYLMIGGQKISMSDIIQINLADTSGDDSGQDDDYDDG
ncbi:MAG: flagellar hook capping FlgD N-terminal domain-containing protein [candidate division Zixibacteria bacterium]